MSVSDQEKVDEISMPNNHKEQLSVVADSCNNLIVNLSPFFGYDCIIEISSWDKGISWTGISDTRIDVITDISELGVPFVTLCELEEASAWLSSFPKGTQKQLIEYELKYRGTLYVLLWFITRSLYARELFETNPLLVWLILKTAQSQRWEITFIFDLFACKRTKILAACGLYESKAVLNILQKLKLPHFKRREFELIVECDWKNLAKHLSHLPFIDARLLTFLKRYPELETSRLIQKYSADWNWRDFEMTFKDTLKMADELRVVDIMSRIRSCKDLPQLITLHDRLVAEVNDKACENMPLIEYGKPPIKETENIVAITNNYDLNKEGKLQRHCIFVYHDSIDRGDYYAYKILAPERATIGLSKTVEGGYVINQIYLRFNGIVSKETRILVETWLESGLDAL